MILIRATQDINYFCYYSAINQLLKVESDLPSFLKILTFDKTNCEDIKKCEDFDTSEVNESLEKVSNEVTHNEQIISRLVFKQ